ncbi:hypothetical protein NUW58_g4455 [Xylaria curta]|uniref:Uncharacterized protein n=1 Tax=Xylaria curta TaxID=42375 RepID=A0ACC1P7K5_9PEZI|nr:hypothetical protein NUW58_g4455 [Xylaria curta]
MKALSRWPLQTLDILASYRRRNGNGYHDDLAAAKCTIYSCLRSYRALISNGKLVESPVGTMPLALNVITPFPPNATIQDIYHEINTVGVDELINKAYQISSVFNYQAVQSPCLVGDTIWTTENMSSAVNGQRILLLQPTSNDTHPFAIKYTTVPIECLYSIEGSALAAISVITNQIFDDVCSRRWSLFQDEPDYTSISCARSFWLSKFYSGAGITATSIMKRIEAFTDRVSNKLRMGLISEPDAVYGQTLETTVCTAVYSKWLLFPTTLVAATSGLLAWSLWRSWKHQNHAMLWKSSILPFLFYSERFEPQNCEDISGDTTISRCVEEERLLTLSEMEFEARRQMVRFRGTLR